MALGDGGVRLRVESIEPDSAVASVVSGGLLRGRPGVALPPGRTELRSPTAADLAALEVLLDVGVDAVAVSFVQSADDLSAVRQLVGSSGPTIVAKIETAPAVAALDEIVRATDAVMVARGDLGVRVPLEDVPHIQKRIIRTTVMHGKPVITATQMLESMVTNPVPTRAEVTDVANAVFDGTSAVMLSGETAIGHDPVAVVEAMARITERAERDFDYRGWGTRMGEQEMAGLADAPTTTRITGAITAAAWRASVDTRACRHPGVHSQRHDGSHDQPLPPRLPDPGLDAVAAHSSSAQHGLGNRARRDRRVRLDRRHRLARGRAGRGTRCRTSR